MSKLVYYLMSPSEYNRWRNLKKYVFYFERDKAISAQKGKYVYEFANGEPTGQCWCPKV